MNGFIRTKDGKIIDLNNIDLNTQLNDKEYYDIRSQKFELIKVVKQADTIEELIKVGDLVRADYDITFICDDPEHHNHLFEIDFINEADDLCNLDLDFEIEKDKITELYTKQGRNYMLVAEKIDGEWRLV